MNFPITYSCYFFPDRGCLPFVNASVSQQSVLMSQIEDYGFT